MSKDALIRLADEVLTFIEQREAEQIAYGVYDLTLTGREVIDGYQPLDGSPFAGEDRTAQIGAALQYLADEVQIIRFDKTSDPADWVFRSRICEVVRLLTKLRQRIVRTDPEKASHRISKSKRLVEDVKFHVAARRVPRRDIPAHTCLKPLLDHNREESRRTAEILLEVIEGELPKLRLMSGFQRRALETILQAIEFEQPVVRASAAGQPHHPDQRQRYQAPAPASSQSSVSWQRVRHDLGRVAEGQGQRSRHAWSGGKKAHPCCALAGD